MKTFFLSLFFLLLGIANLQAQCYSSLTIVEYSGAPNDWTMCQGDIGIINANGGIVQSWSTGQTGQSIVFTANNVGSYAINAIILVGGTCYTVASATVTVCASPVSSIKAYETSGIPNDARVCAGSPVTLVGNGNGNYLWSTGETTQTIVVYPNLMGVNNYSLTITNGNNCPSISTADIIVYDQPIANIFAPQGGDVCQCDVFLIADMGNENPLGVIWSDWTTDIFTNITNPGTYSVTVTDKNGCTDSASFTVTGGTPPTANFNSSVNGLTVTFQNSSTGANQALWNFGDGQTSNEYAPTHTFPGPGTYTVNLYVSSPCGSNAISKQVTVQNPCTPPDANFTLANGSGCGRLEVKYYSTSTGTGPLSHSWIFPGGNPSSSTEVNPVVTYDYVGHYSASLTVTNACGSDVFNLPNCVNVTGQAPEISAGPDLTLCPCESGLWLGVDVFGTTNYSIVWSPSSSLSNPYAHHPWASPNSTTTYTVVVTDFNGCSASDQMTLIVPGTVANEEIFEKKVSVFPNPTSELLNINLPEEGGEYSVELYDKLGHLIFIKNGSNVIQVNVKEYGLVAGIYTAKIFKVNTTLLDQMITTEEVIIN